MVLLPKNSSKKRKRGFALLMSVIIAGIILTISVSVVNNALKEVILAATARQSLISFYWADSGTECFLYWENIRGRWDATEQKSLDSAFEDGSMFNNIECNDLTIPVEKDELRGAYYFWMQDDIKDECSYVDKLLPIEDGATTTVQSWGFNSCDPSNTRRVDRALEIKY